MSYKEIRPCRMGGSKGEEIEGYKRSTETDGE